MVVCCMGLSVIGHCNGCIKLLLKWLYIKLKAFSHCRETSFPVHNMDFVASVSLMLRNIMRFREIECQNVHQEDQQSDCSAPSRRRMSMFKEIFVAHTKPSNSTTLQP